MEAETFGQRMKTARELVGLSGAELARRAGLSKGHLHNIEQDKCQPSFENMNKLRDALGIKWHGDSSIIERILLTAWRDGDYSRILTMVAGAMKESLNAR